MPTSILERTESSALDPASAAPRASGGWLALFASLGCTEVNFDPNFEPASGGTTGAGGISGGSGAAGGAGASPPNGGASSLLPTPTEPRFDQQGSAYAELQGDLAAMQAADANGHLSQLKLAETALSRNRACRPPTASTRCPP